MAVASTTKGERFDAGAAPNDLWRADFKGEFRLGDGRYCYPLTVTDHASPASDYRRWRRHSFHDIGTPRKITESVTHDGVDGRCVTYLSGRSQ
jgi:hypothetical protein